MARNDNFFFPLILSRSCLVLALKEAILMFFIFLNFFAIFLEFPIPGRVEMDRTNNFFFSHPRPLSSRFGMKRSHNNVFLIFLLFFLEFPISGRV